VLSSSEFVDDEEQIIQCLEHVRLPGLLCYFSHLASWHYCLGCVGLDLLRTHACDRAMELSHGACTAEHESDNTKLRLQLEQTR
jgi:hypothetical protein